MGTMTILIIVFSVLIGFIAFPLVLFLLRDVLPPTLFTPSDWD